MRTIRFMAALALVTTLVGASACAKESTVATHPPMGVTERQPEGERVSSTDARFFRDAYSDASAELTIGRMAEHKGTTPEVRQLGRKLAVDSTRQLTDLRDIAAANRLGLPTALEPKDADAVSHLSAVTGRTFDRDFLVHVRLREQAVLPALKREDEHGRNADLREYAGSELPTVRAQIDRARAVGVTSRQKR
jgi:putative membrane protein